LPTVYHLLWAGSLQVELATRLDATSMVVVGGVWMMGLLRVGNRVLFEDAEHQVAALTGTWVRLVATADSTPSAVLLTHLVGSPGFAVIGASKRCPS
jgi:hypothetical protein